MFKYVNEVLMEKRENKELFYSSLFITHLSYCTANSWGQTCSLLLTAYYGLTVVKASIRSALTAKCFILNNLERR